MKPLLENCFHFYILRRDRYSGNVWLTTLIDIGNLQSSFSLFLDCWGGISPESQPTQTVHLKTRKLDLCEHCSDCNFQSAWSLSLMNRNYTIRTQLTRHADCLGMSSGLFPLFSLYLMEKLYFVELFSWLRIMRVFIFVFTFLRLRM